MPVLVDQPSVIASETSVLPTVEGHDATGRAVLQQAAQRYWLLRSQQEELRFTHLAAARRWAGELAGRGIATQLTRHDENTPRDAREDLASKMDC
jgi:hypothetical protein